MYYIGKRYDSYARLPLAVLGSFLIPAIMILLLQREPVWIISASDSILGVGMAVWFFRKQHPDHGLGYAFSFAALLIVVYGLLRYHLFEELHIQLFDKIMESIRTQFPVMSKSLSPANVSIIRFLMPSGWIVFQLVGLFAGLMFMLRGMGYRDSLRRFRLPGFLSYLLIAIMPMYFFERLWFPFVNCLIGISFIYFFQGFALLVSKMTQYVPNPILSTVLMIFIMLNVISYFILAILGFADQWLDFRKIESNGGTN